MPTLSTESCPLTANSARWRTQVPAIATLRRPQAND